MATNQVYRLGIYEGILTIFFAADEAMEVGDVVKLDSDGKVTKAAAGATAFGFSAQTVTTAGVADYAPGGLVSHTAKVGDKIGVYIAGGIYKANTLGGSTPVPGDKLYLSATAGKLTKTAGSETVPVGILVEAPNSDGVYKFKSLL